MRSGSPGWLSLPFTPCRGQLKPTRQEILEADQNPRFPAPRKPDRSASCLETALDDPSILKLSRRFLLGLLIILPLLGYWAARVEFGTPEARQWLPSGDLAVQEYDQFRKWFGEDQFVLLSWEGCTLDDPRLPRLAEHLRELISSHPEYGILSIEDSARSLRLLTQPELGIERQAAIERLSGIAIGPNGAGFITVRLIASAPSTYQPLLDMLSHEAASQVGNQPQDLILAGEPVQVAIIDRSSRETISNYVLPSSIGALLVAWICVGNLRLTLIIFALAGIGQLIGLALISYFLGEMSAVIVVLPTLIFMLTLSAAIHLANYYLDSGGDSQPHGGARALRLGVRPCVLAAATTAFGFGSLAVSRLAPVWHFGSLAALGLLLSITILLLAFPGLVQMPLRLAWWREPAGRGALASSSADSASEGAWQLHIASCCQRWNLPITIAGVGVLIVSLLGIPQLKTTTEFTDMFSSSSPGIRSLDWVKENVGPIDTLEVCLRFPMLEPEDAQADVLQRLSLVRLLHEDLQRLQCVASVASASTLLPQVPQADGLRNTVLRAVMRKRIEARCDTLVAAKLLAIEEQQQVWRLTLKIRGMRNDNFDRIHTLLEQVCQARLEASQTSQAFQPALSATYTISGLRKVVETANTSLLSDLGMSFLTAFLLITPVMMLIARGFVSGLILMIPNTLPVALVFGAMGWLEIRLDVASILTASVALGIAVDDTLHFVSWYLRTLRQGDSRQQAVRSGLMACARPMLHTSVICTGAMLPFFFSEFLPTSKFALLMILILAGAIVGDLILLPALLLSPLGKRVGHSQPQLNGVESTS